MIVKYCILIIKWISPSFLARENHLSSKLNELMYNSTDVSDYLKIMTSINRFENRDEAIDQFLYRSINGLKYCYRKDFKELTRHHFTFY